jgi:hypothetical protein
MKRLLLVLAGGSACLAFAAVAAATTPPPSLSLQVNGVTSLTVSPGAKLIFTGSLANVNRSHSITVYEYTNSSCTANQSFVGSESTNGAFSISYTLPSNALIGKHYYMAKHAADEIVPNLSSNCVTVTVAAAAILPPPENNVFLCYSAFQDSPGSWPVGEAAALIKTGYWSPYAVLGSVTDGTNVGGYHLACNLATGQSAGESTLGGAGEVYGVGAKSDVKDVPGHYPVIG